ncbi:MAG: hypothetical protein AAB373_05720 [Patescibacteria group bacterium]
MEELEKNLWRKIDYYLKFLRFVPFLRMVAVCNNLAFGRVNKHSDIDLFIVARAGRLFMVRTFVTCILHVLGVRRHGKKVAGRFCLSFFVDDSRLNLERIALNQDVYLAYWIKSLQPILDDGVSREFFAKNGWIERYLSDERLLARFHSTLKFGKAQGFFERILDGGFGNFIEKILKKWQLKRAGKKLLLAGEKSSLIVDEHILKFHNLDRRKLFRNYWFKVYGKDQKVDSGRFMNLAKEILENKD